MKIDVNFDFTSDTPCFWDNYWEKDELLGGAKVDPDSKSKTMQLYHKYLYSKPLPNGEVMELTIGTGKNYLTWKNFSFGSDILVTSFRYKRYKETIQKVANKLTNFQKYIEEYMHKSYTLGGEIIFPKMQGGINQSRGCNPFIKDRWDLTLECIRKFYNGENSPLYETLSKNKPFFDLFLDFKGYVDFFYLQDCVSADYSKVNFWIGEGKFEYYPLPQNVEEYMLWIEKGFDFVNKRNLRISEDIKRRKL